MDQMDVSLAGRINVRGDGNVIEDRFSLTASADFAKGGRITLNANPGFRPSAALKDGKTNLTDASQLSGIGNLDDIDVSISKSADILGQACDLTLSTESLGNGGIAGLQVKTNVDKVGDVTLTLAKKGHKAFSGKSKDGEAQASENDACRIDVALPLSDVHADLTGSVNYDLNTQDANLSLGYKNGDVALRLRTSMGSDKSLSHKVNADYSGIEGIGLGLEVNDAGAGKVTVTKDQYSLVVPVSKDGGVDTNNASLRMTWSMDM